MKKILLVGDAWRMITASMIVVVIAFVFMVQPCVATESTDDFVLPKIIGGRDAASGAWPAMVSLSEHGSSNYYSSHECGGTLIGKKWVVTAAHCIEDCLLRATNSGVVVECSYLPSNPMNTSVYQVVLNAHDLTSNTEAFEVLRSKRVIIHPVWHDAVSNREKDDPLPYEGGYDIALIELESESAQQPRAVYGGSNSLDGMTSTLIGWGLTDTADNNISSVQQEVDVPIISNATCEKSYPGRIHYNQLCAGYAAGGKDSCVGDSGGPLMVQMNNTSLLAGVVSWGKGCAEPDYYGINTRISSFTSWIGQYVADVNIVTGSSDIYSPAPVVPPLPSTNINLSSVYKLLLAGSVGGKAPSSTVSPNRIKTEMLAGHWRFIYTIYSSFSQDYYLDANQIEESSSIPDLYYIFGEDQYGDIIIASYSPALGMYSLLDKTTLFDRFFTFSFSGTDAVDGCFYLVQNGSLSRCYPMSGILLNQINNALLSKESVRLFQDEQEAQCQQEIKELDMGETTFVKTGLGVHQAAQESYKWLKIILTKKSNFQR